MTVVRPYNIGYWEGGNKISTKDASDLTSPVLVDTLTIKSIKVPQNAVVLILSGTTDLRISEDSNMTSYFLLPSGATLMIGVATQDVIYVKGDSGSGACYFMFELI